MPASILSRAVAAGLLAAALAAPLVVGRLGDAPFDDPGEGMHAEIARELRHGGSPLGLTLNGVPYVDKPPLLYVLMVASFALLGESEGTARAVPAGAALAAVGVTAWLGARLLGPGAGLLAGLALLTCPGFFAYARYVRPETLFVAALVTGLALAIKALQEGRRGVMIAALTAFGVAGLAKDPLGALAPPLVVGAAMLAAGRGRPVGRWLPWPGVAVAVLLGLGWWSLVEVTTPGTLWYMAVDNHLLNVARARHFPDEDVPLGAWEFLLVGGLGAFPWIVGAGVALVTLARRRAWRDAGETPWVLLGLWTVAVLGAMALSPFRLPHYGLPAYPAVALLAVRAWREHGPRLLPPHAAMLALLAVVAMAVALSDGDAFRGAVLGATDVATRKTAAAGEAAALPPWEAFRPLLGWAAVVFGAGALVLAAVAILGRRGVRPLIACTIVGVTMLALLPAVAAALGAVAGHRAVKAIARMVGDGAAAGDIIVHEGPLENSGAFEWYAGRRPRILAGRASVLGFGATLPSAPDVFMEAADLRRTWESAARVWVVSVRGPERSLVPALDGARPATATGGRWLYVNR